MATCSFWRIKNISKALRSSPYLFQEGKFNVRSNSSYSSSSGAKPGMSVTRLGLISVGLGALVGTGYSFHKMYEARVPILNKGTGAESFVLKSLPDVATSRSQLNDSSMIISALMSYLYERDQTLQDVVKFYPSIEYKDDNGTVKKEIMNRYFLMFHGNIPKDRTKEDILLERKWRKWVDDVLVHTLSPNVYRTRAEAFQAFNWFSEVGEWDKLFPAWERFIMVYVGAVAMWIIGKRLKRRHNLKDDVRQSLYDECNFWIKTIKKQGTPFLGGSRPNLADLAVYGALTSIEGCNAFADLLANTKIGPWYSAMKESVQNHAGSVAMSS
ncbi:prostaglandin E synthase 2-like isoform X3 [Schistocerca piceifrons]|uniref:prostaglandin E synthase 2-like isoform X3 n=1 Tax=Schistocerca piceifrons TaxID=274613 RepID=UPI001F5F5F47|nr:prostaglandin E synthase 2-like isoform X3 [Schistocerca piceifrons]